MTLSTTTNNYIYQLEVAVYSNILGLCTIGTPLGFTSIHPPKYHSVKLCHPTRLIKPVKVTLRLVEWKMIYEIREDTGLVIDNFCCLSNHCRRIPVQGKNLR
jgi:hypothetical protein